jgi:hypothetical protein
MLMLTSQNPINLSQEIKNTNLACSRQALNEEYYINNNMGELTSFDTIYDMFELETPCLKLDCDVEKTGLKYNTTHKMWNLIQIQAVDDGDIYLENIDIVIIVDISASMIMDEKLMFVQASLQYLLERLNDGHRLAVVVFNHEVTVLSDLVNCSEGNKEVILKNVRMLQASGSTNITDAIDVGTKILLQRENLERISSVLLITDGLSNAGANFGLDKIVIPKNCIFNTFGFGADHDSNFLHKIAFQTQGVYYYVPSKNEINSTFGECIHSILTTRITDVRIKITANDGSRIVTLATPFKIEEKKLTKEYNVNLGLLQSGEKKNILMRLSLRKMDKIIKKHKIFNVKISYYDIKKGKYQLQSKDIVIDRAENNYGNMPTLLDQNLNRYAAAKTIIEAIDLSNNLQFSEAQKKITECIKSIKQSPSGESPYTQFIIKDLKDCKEGMNDILSFQNGIHTAHAFASMHFLERSSGILNTLRKNLIMDLDNIKEIGYGYINSGYLSNVMESEMQCSKIIDQYRNK